jgi:hypothetical protein
MQKQGQSTKYPKQNTFFCFFPFKHFIPISLYRIRQFFIFYNIFFKLTSYIYMSKCLCHNIIYICSDYHPQEWRYSFWNCFLLCYQICTSYFCSHWAHHFCEWYKDWENISRLKFFWLKYRKSNHVQGNFCFRKEC